MTFISCSISSKSQFLTMNVVVEDRKEAIKAAIEMANKLDIVVIAGKGHEMYQEVKGKKNEFNEKKIVIEITDELKKKQEEKSTKKKK